MQLRSIFLSCALWSITCALFAASKERVIVHTSASTLQESVAQLRAWKETYDIPGMVVADPGWYLLTADASVIAQLNTIRGVEIITPEEAQGDPRFMDASASGHAALSWLASPYDAEQYGSMNDDGHCGGAHEAPVVDPEETMAGTARVAFDMPLDHTGLEVHNSEHLSGFTWITNFFIWSDEDEDYNWTAAAVEERKLQVLYQWEVMVNTAALPENDVDLFPVMQWGGGPSGTNNPEEPLPAVWDSITIPYASTQPWVAMALAQEPEGITNAHAWNAFKRRENNCDHAAIMCHILDFWPGLAGFAFWGGPSGCVFADGQGAYMHEVAHMFHAYDEDGGFYNECEVSFNGAQNLNSLVCGENGSCLMNEGGSTYVDDVQVFILCPHTPYHLGWKGLLPAPELYGPADEAILTDPLVNMSWQATDPPANATTYVHLANMSTQELLETGYADEPTMHTRLLVNGVYKWKVWLAVDQVGANYYNGFSEVPSLERIFEVNAPLNASFIVDQGQGPHCPGAAITFTDQSTGAPSSWSWQFIGGVPETYSGPNPPPVVFTTPGPHEVRLRVGDGVGTNQLNVSDAVIIYTAIPLPYASHLEPEDGWVISSQTNCGAFQWSAVSGTWGEGYRLNSYGFTGSCDGTTLTSPIIDLSEATHPILRLRYAFRSGKNDPPRYFMLMARECLAEVGTAIEETDERRFWPKVLEQYTASQWEPTTQSDWRIAVFDLTAVAGLQVRLDLSWIAQPSTFGGQDFYLDEIDVRESIPVPIKVLLQGPYEPVSQTMANTLREVISAVEPYTAMGVGVPGDWYNVALPYMAIWPNSGNENNAVVDWVMVELRNTSSPYSVVHQRPALVQRDGDVVEADGISPVHFFITPGEYRIAVRHRNHLGAMTNANVTVQEGMSAVDFTDPNMATYGTNARTVSGTKALLWAGNARRDNVLRYTGTNNDRDQILTVVGSTTPNNVVDGYYVEDTGMNGQVKYTGTGNDRDIILVNVGSTTPNNTITEQVP